MSNQTTVKIQLDSTAKSQAENILKNSGITMNTAVNMFIQEINKHGRIPFTKLPNEAKNNFSYEINSDDLIKYLTCS